MFRKHPILVIEDSDEDFYATARILRKFVVARVERCSSGSQVLPHLAGKANLPGEEPPPAPCLILLDLNLCGRRDGRSVLRDLKSDRRYRQIPVVVMTTSSNPADVSHCYSLGAAGYIVKPVDLDKFTDSIESMVRYWLQTVTLPPRPEGAV
jgi:CheY-like chemotaxis protein